MGDGSEGACRASNGAHRAIGGVTVSSLPAIAATGAAGVAVITLLTQSTAPEADTAAMRTAFRGSLMVLLKK